MTATPPQVVDCPRCGTANVVPLSDGTRLCLECRTEWDPANPPEVVAVRAPEGPTVEVPEVEVPTIVIPDPEPAAETGTGTGEVALVGPDRLAELRAEAEASDEATTGEVAVLPGAAEAVLDALKGTAVILEGGQTATIVDFPDDDHVTVRLSDGTEETVEVGVVERAVVDPTGPGPVTVDLPDEAALQLAQVNAQIAVLVLRAAKASIADAGDGWVLQTPPSGWLPDDPEARIVIEQGAAYAVAALVLGLGLPPSVLDAVALDIETTAQTGSHEGTSNNGNQ